MIFGEFGQFQPKIPTLSQMSDLSPGFHPDKPRLRPGQPWPPRELVGRQGLEVSHHHQATPRARDGDVEAAGIAQETHLATGVGTYRAHQNQVLKKTGKLRNWMEINGNAGTNGWKMDEKWFWSGDVLGWAVLIMIFEWDCAASASQTSRKEKSGAGSRQNDEVHLWSSWNCNSLIPKSSCFFPASPIFSTPKLSHLPSLHPIFPYWC